MSSVCIELAASVPGCIGAADLGGGTYRLDFAASSRAATAAEVLEAARAERIAAINAECRARLIARYGPAEEQVSRAIGVYGAQEQSAMQAGIAATIDASNAAQNAILAAADIAAVEAVTVAWPVI